MPQGSMRKFFAERGGPSSPHKDNLTWPGTRDGFPFRGATADMRQEEYEDIPLALDYHSQVFQLWDDYQKATFDQVMDRVVNGWYMQHRRIDRWSDEHCGLIVWLEWVQIYGETPGTKSPSGGSHGQTYQAIPPSDPHGTISPGQAGPGPATGELAAGGETGHPAIVKSTRAS